MSCGFEISAIAFPKLLQRNPLNSAVYQPSLLTCDATFLLFFSSSPEQHHFGTLHRNGAVLCMSFESFDTADNLLLWAHHCNTNFLHVICGNLGYCVTGAVLHTRENVLALPCPEPIEPITRGAEG